MPNKKKSVKGDEPIKKIDLKLRHYKEGTLVDLVCTEAQKRSYHRKEKFANKKQYEMFLERLSRHCRFEKIEGSDKYKILEIFQYPKSTAELKIHNGIYQYLTPLILDEIINNRNDRQTLFNTYELVKASYLVNDNYTPMKFAQDEVSSGLHIPYKTVAEYFDKTDYYIRSYLRKCIQYLHDMSCVIFKEVFIIKRVTFTDVQVNLNTCRPTGKAEIRKATDDEMNLYAKLLEKADNEIDIHSNQERWYGPKANSYKKTLSYLLRENNIEYVTSGFEIFCVHPDRCKAIMQTFSDKTLNECRQVIGSFLKSRSDFNAQNRITKGKVIDFDRDYIENFKNLSEISMLYGAEDIAKRIPEVKKSYAKRREDRSKMIECEYTEL